ncbi:hypothetical protein K6119_15825 [Paracrocinitomix mangrovi]|uniref:hypothetical protein n=1 Tax=Paracrocinitomix mangrovi TaxID=2862509 RepID=UPI001C8E319B|nr:hypothetical protein [Paracrocinitomix mangrovi]UKN01199.1 hypothetical protein K6119_15825 [Paracrocinitomix mangrovi]
MDEMELFNNDVMYWREVKFYLPAKNATLQLVEAIEIEGTHHQTIDCFLVDYQTHNVEHAIENGGAFIKNEVKSWQYVLPKFVELYHDKSLSETDKEALLQQLPHSNLRSITLKDKAGKIVLEKGKA